MIKYQLSNEKIIDAVISNPKKDSIKENDRLEINIITNIHPPAKSIRTALFHDN